MFFTASPHKGSGFFSPLLYVQPESIRILSGRSDKRIAKNGGKRSISFWGGSYFLTEGFLHYFPIQTGCQWADAGCGAAGQPLFLHCFTTTRMIPLSGNAQSEFWLLPLPVTIPFATHELLHLILSPPYCEGRAAGGGIQEASQGHSTTLELSTKT